MVRDGVIIEIIFNNTHFAGNFALLKHFRENHVIHSANANIYLS
jgi:hypothetical protein